MVSSHMQLYVDRPSLYFHIKYGHVKTLAFRLPDFIRLLTENIIWQDQCEIPLQMDLHNDIICSSK